MIRLMFGLVIAACVLTLLVLLAQAVFRWARPQGMVVAFLAAAGALFVAYSLLAAVAGT